MPSRLGLWHCLRSASAAGLMMQAYLDDFDDFCSRLGGATAVVMGDLLAFEVRRPHIPPPHISHSHTHVYTYTRTHALRVHSPAALGSVVMCCRLAPLQYSTTDTSLSLSIPQASACHV